MRWDQTAQWRVEFGWRVQPPKEVRMAWETPIVTEIAVGMEVTAYVSEDEVLF
jgi:coenzyme PQQ precursor peptide PqqA